MASNAEALRPRLPPPLPLRRRPARSNACIVRAWQFASGPVATSIPLMSTPSRTCRKCIVTDRGRRCTGGGRSNRWEPERMRIPLQCTIDAAHNTLYAWVRRFARRCRGRVRAQRARCGCHKVHFRLHREWRAAEGERDADRQGLVPVSVCGLA